MKTIACTILLATVVGWGAAQEASGVKELETWSAEFAEAWNRNDVPKLTTIFVEQGDILDPFGRHFRGREEITKFVQKQHAAELKGSNFKIRSVEVRMVKPDVAVMDWDVELTRIKDRSGNASGELKHHVTWMMEKRAGKWEVWASRPAAPLPAPTEKDGSVSPDKAAK